MNRRILLIDADPGFFQTLSDTLSRYAFDVVNEADPDQALLLAGAAPPALLIVGVDEPDKHGFKVFQKCKKGSLAKVPIMLVTSSVTAESFAKHRGLKTHADEYVDKRTIAGDQLLKKLDALVTLGDPLVEDSLDIPVEMEDIPMGDDGDMVLEEELGADDAGGDFGDDPHSPLSISGAANLVDDPHLEPAAVESRRVDSMVDSDIEDAFGGLLGDDYVEPAALQTAAPFEEPELEAAPIPEPVPEPMSELAAEVDAVPERMGEATLPPPFSNEPATTFGSALVEEAVPGAIHDGGLSAAEDINAFDNPAAQSTRGPDQLAEGLGDQLRDAARAELVPVEEPADFANEQAPVVQAEESEEADRAERTRVSTGYESSPATQLDDMDLQPLDEGALIDEGVLAEAGEDSAVPEPVPHVNVRERDPDPAPEPARPKFIENSTGTNIGAAPAPAATPPAGTRTTAVLNVVDLGLDRIAQDADRDQSGLHDRRELRKINELERQLAQLKTELERTRATAESTTRTGGREGEFLKLRENLLTHQKDIQKAKDELAARDRALADVQERLGQVQQTKAALEAKSLELEQRAATDSSRVAAIEARERALTAQLATVQQELSHTRQTADNAETVRNQLERDVANERALRASSASDAERSLRVEREQMIARHQGELATLRAGAVDAQEQVLAALRMELEAVHTASLGAATDAGRREIAIEAEAAVTQLEQRQATDLKRIADGHAALLAQKAAETEQLEDEHVAALAQKSVEMQRLIDALAAAQTQKSAELQRLGDESAGKIVRLAAERDAAIEKARAEAQRAAEEARAEASGQVVAASVANDRIVEELRGEIARLQSAAEATEAEHTAEFQTAAANQAAALAEQSALHNAGLAKREKENVAAREADAVANAASLNELRVELERQSATHGVKLDVAKREVDLMIEQHELTKQQLVEQQRRDADALAAQHRDELAKVAADKERAIEDIQRASAEHRAAVERAAAQHRDELVAQKDAADRELAEFRSALQAAKKSIEDATARHTAERETADQAHATAVSELTAHHERALAVVNGEVVRTKAVGDAEHGRATAAKDAEHKAALAAKEAELQRQVAEISAERDELRKGLSGSRDAHKRTESELATAVQTIADRNSELRTHAQAVAERDQRIAELRKEIETVEQENTSYQEQVLRAYQKIKTDEAMVARAKKAMAIALTVLDDQSQTKES